MVPSKSGAHFGQRVGVAYPIVFVVRLSPVGLLSRGGELFQSKTAQEKEALRALAISACGLWDGFWAV
jgi:hypothetical protein